MFLRTKGWSALSSFYVSDDVIFSRGGAAQAVPMVFMHPKHPDERDGGVTKIYHDIII
jgi:hypothetical protein